MRIPRRAFVKGAAVTSAFALIGPQRARSQTAGDGQDQVLTEGAGLILGNGHDHAIARNTPILTTDTKTFWGALGCSCFAV